MSEGKSVAIDTKDVEVVETTKYDNEDAGAAPNRKSVIDRKTQMIDLSRLKNLDPELTELFAELDLDGDGTINASELTQAFAVIRDTRKESDEWKKAAFRRTIAIVALLFINLVLIGSVTYYIVWSTTAVKVDKDGNLKNHKDDSEESSPVVTATFDEKVNGLEDLFLGADYSDITFLSYTCGEGCVQHLRPTGFSTFTRMVPVDGTIQDTEVVVAYLGGDNAVVFENMLPPDANTEYVVEPFEPYPIQNAPFGTMTATDNLDKLPTSQSKVSTLRRLAGTKASKPTKDTSKLARTKVQKLNREERVRDKNDSITKMRQRQKDRCVDNGWGSNWSDTKGDCKDRRL